MNTEFIPLLDNKELSYEEARLKIEESIKHIVNDDSLTFIQKLVAIRELGAGQLFNDEREFINAVDNLECILDGS